MVKVVARLPCRGKLAIYAAARSRMGDEKVVRLRCCVSARRPRRRRIHAARDGRRRKMWTWEEAGSIPTGESKTNGNLL